MLVRYRNVETPAYEYPSYHSFRTKEEARQEHTLYGDKGEIEFVPDTHRSDYQCVTNVMIRTYKWKRGGYLPKG